MQPLPMNAPEPRTDAVRCLECGTIYSKPVEAGTVASNPGCPDCGYVGWLAVTIPVNEDFAPRRSAAGPPPPRSA